MISPIDELLYDEEDKAVLVSNVRAAIDRSDVVTRNCLETNPNPRLATFIHLCAIVDNYCTELLDELSFL